MEVANSKLTEYSKNVYELEKENSKNMILENVITTRVSFINKLINDIDKMQVSLESGNADIASDIDNAIELNQEILSEVR